MAHSRQYSSLPRWRGFALQDLDTVKAPYNQSDFQTIAAYGFNFVRLALGYEYITHADLGNVGGTYTSGLNPPTTTAGGSFYIQMDADVTNKYSNLVTIGSQASGAAIASAAQTAIRALGRVYAGATVSYTGSAYVFSSGTTGYGSAVRISPATNNNDIARSLFLTDDTGAIASDGYVGKQVLDPVALGYIDQAISWCQVLGIHVMLDMHETPGYAVTNPYQTPSLWTDATYQMTFVGYWAALATRYKGIPNTQLSFNLLNEPENITHKNYAVLIRSVIEAIRAADPVRLVWADGAPTALAPVSELMGTGIGQAYHGLYTPMSISHYGAVWLQGFDQMPVPVWPATLIDSLIYGNDYPDYILPIYLQGSFQVGDTISLSISQCNIRAQYQIWDMTNNVLLSDSGLLVMTSTGPGTPYQDPVWKVWSNKDLGVVVSATLTAPTDQIAIKIPNGNWSSIDTIQVVTQGVTNNIQPNTMERAGYYGLPATVLSFDDSGNYSPISGNWNIDTIRGLVKAWTDLLTRRGIDIAITEGGVFHTVPDAVTHACLRDHLQVLKEYNLGFTIWNLRGPFGPFDSGRNMTGVCNVANDGVTVTFVSYTNGYGQIPTSFYYWPPGQPITVGGASSSIASVASNLATLTLATPVTPGNGQSFSYGSTNYETVTFPDNSVHYLDTAMMALLQDQPNVTTITPPINNTLVCMGDSITNWPQSGVFNNNTYPYMTQELVGGNCRSVNLGIAGQTTTQMLARVSEMLSQGIPGVATIFGGINDQNDAISTSTTQSNLEAMVTYLQNAGCQRIMLCNIHHVDNALVGWDYDTGLNPYRAAILAAGIATNVPVCDFYQVSLIIPDDYNVAHPAAHLMSSGEQKLANYLKAQLDSLGWSAVLHE